MKPETMILPDGNEVTTIHFLSQPAGAKPFLACLPGMMGFSADSQRGRPMLRSEDHRAINCPLCKATDAYKLAAGIPIGVKK